MGAGAGAWAEATWLRLHGWSSAGACLVGAGAWSIGWEQGLVAWAEAAWLESGWGWAFAWGMMGAESIGWG